MDRTGAGQATQATGLAGAELDDAIIKPVLTAALEGRTDSQTGGGARHTIISYSSQPYLPNPCNEFQDVYGCVMLCEL